MTITMIDYKRYNFLERQLDREDLSDELYTQYTTEINSMQDAINVNKAKRDAERAARLKEEQEEAEMQKVMSLTEEQVEKMYEDSCLKYQDVNGTNFRDWYAQSLKYYTIDEEFNVHAKARSPNTVEVVPHPTLAQAKLTILLRIKYKFYDHAVKGHDFKYEL